jgi:hypothetical protein
VFKRKRYTAKEFRAMSVIYFIISGFLLIGIIPAFIFEGLEKTMLFPFILMLTSLITGVLYRIRGHRVESN